MMRVLVHSLTATVLGGSFAFAATDPVKNVVTVENRKCATDSDCGAIMTSRCCHWEAVAKPAAAKYDSLLCATVKCASAQAECREKLCTLRAP